VGLWLAQSLPGQQLVGFCGFLEFPSIHPEPQLVYAIFKRFTGQGYGTEMARAAMAEARRHPRFATIVAAVDEVNAASVRLLEKLGFILEATQSGHFGNVLVMAVEGVDEGV
jgi:ribosomal-protein-alanine N-acetyltransferase